MRLKFLLAAIALLLTLPHAEASWVRGNDTSGIIPWSRDAELKARHLATEHCGYYGKYPRITGVVRKYGQYISFNCLWHPNIARAALPPVRLAKPHCHRVWSHDGGRRHRVLVCH